MYNRPRRCLFCFFPSVHVSKLSFNLFSPGTPKQMLCLVCCNRLRSFCFSLLPLHHAMAFTMWFVGCCIRARAQRAPPQRQVTALALMLARFAPKERTKAPSRTHLDICLFLLGIWETIPNGNIVCKKMCGPRRIQIICLFPNRVRRCRFRVVFNEVVCFLEKSFVALP